MAKRAGWEKILELKIEKCVQGGAGLARLPDGQVCFVEGALPGEALQIKIIEHKRDFARASIARVLEPHEKRRAAPCPYYGKCGGCNAQHAEFELQIEILRQIVFDLFSRIAKLSLPQDFEISSGAEWGYRHRARIFPIGNKWGFKARGSNAIMPIDKCMILSEKLNGKIGTCFDNQSEKFLGRHICADETVFFQSNLELLPKLINAVATAAVGGTLLDIFSGVGLFSAFLQDKFENIIAVEENPDCQKFAEKNLGGNCKFYAKRAEDFFAENACGFSDACAIIDPPRPGLSNVLLERICKAKIQKLIYVSCNPATLARDARKFLNAGYELKNIQGFAFYPQTFHLEMLAEFSLNPRAKAISLSGSW